MCDLTFITKNSINFELVVHQKLAYLIKLIKLGATALLPFSLLELNNHLNNYYQKYIKIE